MTFGTAAEAASLARHINAIHAQVHGHLQAPAGVFPAETPYVARDPELLLWVHSTVVSSHLLAYTTYIGPITPEERDGYCAEVSAIGRLLGIPADFVPTNTACLQDYIDGMLASGEIVVTEAARALAHDLLSPPALGVARPLVWLIYLPTIGILPLRSGTGTGSPGIHVMRGHSGFRRGACAACYSLCRLGSATGRGRAPSASHLRLSQEAWRCDLHLHPSKHESL